METQRVSREKKKKTGGRKRKKCPGELLPRGKREKGERNFSCCCESKALLDRKWRKGRSGEERTAVLEHSAQNPAEEPSRTERSTDLTGPYLFGWAERCSGSCATCQPWPAFWHQCWSASSCRRCLPCRPPCPTGCRPSSPGCTCRRWCLCSWSCSSRPTSPSACFSFWMQSHCQPPPLTGEGGRRGQRRGDRPEERMWRERWWRRRREVRIEEERRWEGVGWKGEKDRVQVQEFMTYSIGFKVDVLCLKDSSCSETSTITHSTVSSSLNRCALT